MAFTIRKPHIFEAQCITSKMKKTTILILALALASGAQAANLNRSGWTWSSSSICAAGTNTDILGLPGLYDGDVNTCWHSNYLAEDGSAERSNPHWIQIDRGNDASSFSGLCYMPRQNSGGNTACTEYYIYLSDTDMSSTPATSSYDIVAALGTPTVSGSWAGDLTEKYADFGKSYTSRYILFVNVQSNDSRSAACAEMNLYIGSPSSGGDEPPVSYNALRVTPVGNDATPHRIAIQGDKLTISMNHEYVRLGNEDITVEYNMAEIARFNFEQYDFEDNSYEGDKKDIYTSRFTPTVKPAAGQIDALNEVTMIISASRQHRVNPDTQSPVVIERDTDTVMSVPHTSLGDFATENGYVFTNIGFTTPGTYTFKLPAELFICADGTRSDYVEREWTILDPNQGQDGIGNAVVSTLTLNRHGSILHIGGIAPGCATAELYDVGGRLVASSTVDAYGETDINVGGLVKGVYFLNVNGITLKIIL